MPRKAREKIPYGTYKIEQSGVQGKRIFESDDDRARFYKLLSEKKHQFNFKVYGIRLEGDNRYELVLYDHGSDISKIMKSINISLSYLFKGRGRIFKDRYKSTLIRTPEALSEVLGTMHPFKPLEKDADILLSAGADKVSINSAAIKNPKLINQVSSQCENTQDCIRSLDKGREMLAEIAGKQGLSLEEFLRNKVLRNEALLKFRKKTTLSLKEIGTLFGGLTESAVCKIISRTK